MIVLYSVLMVAGEIEVSVIVLGGRVTISMWYMVEGAAVDVIVVIQGTVIDCVAVMVNAKRSQPLPRIELEVEPPSACALTWNCGCLDDGVRRKR